MKTIAALIVCGALLTGCAAQSGRAAAAAQTLSGVRSVEYTHLGMY